MDGIAAEIAEEIAVLFQYRHTDTGARQQKPQHHPGRAAADDTAFRGNRAYAMTPSDIGG